MNKDKVFEVLTNAAEPLDAKALVELTGLERADVDKAIKALKKEGKVESPKRCFYSVV